MENANQLENAGYANGSLRQSVLDGADWDVDLREIRIPLDGESHTLVMRLAGNPASQALLVSAKEKPLPRVREGA